jgi:negative regulator of sigma E activity
MNNTNHSQSNIEKALTMYKENVSPSETYFQAILSQIPEQQKLKEGRAIRSPYRWLAITQMVTLAAIILVVTPTYTNNSAEQANPYFETDKQIELFEKNLDTEDYERSIKDYSL